MNWPNVILVFATTILAVYLESAVVILREWLGAQVDLLPALAVYTALTCNFPTVAAMAVLGGLWFDSISANPLGVTVLPLLLIGFLVYRNRDLLLKEQAYAQFLLGLVASAFCPLCVVLLLYSLGKEPLIGWTSLWQWLVMSFGGAILTPMLFLALGHLNRLFSYPTVAVESSFRPDREIKRGRY